MPDTTPTATATQLAHVAAELHALIELLGGLQERHMRSPEDSSRRELIGACVEVEDLAARIQEGVRGIAASVRVESTES